MKRNPYSRYYVPSNSPWPFLVAVFVNGMAISFILWVQSNASLYFMGVSSVGMIISVFSWWRDLIREGDLGLHTRFVIKGLCDGISLFILSEMMFFFPFLWNFFHIVLSPSCELGGGWPHSSMNKLDLSVMMLFNISLWVSSGLFICQASKSLKLKDYDVGPLLGLSMALLCTCFIFVFQVKEVPMNFREVQGSVRMSSVGLMMLVHAIFNILGMVWVSVVLFRLWRGGYSSRRHFGFEACVRYWHFVDIIWILISCLMFSWSG